MEKVTFKKSENFKKNALKLFNEQRTKLQQLLSNADVQHVGGTAVPHLLTKGDVDINVRVGHVDFPAVVKKLKSTYEIHQPENWTETFASFKDDHSFELPLGIQVTVKGSIEDDFVDHRDALRQNPKLVERFNEIKKEFEGQNMTAYRAAKSEFLEGI